MQVHLNGPVLQVRDIKVGPQDAKRDALELSVQIDTAQIARVRLDPAKFQGTPPVAGDVVQLVCWVSAWKHEGSGEVRQTISTQRYYEPLPTYAVAV